MGFLNSIPQPTGFWFNILFAFENWLGSYVLGIILITVIIKLALLPLDVVNKYTSKKNSRVQQILKPEIEKIKKKYSNNPQMENQKTMELYKRENHSVIGTCVGMLVYMALTLTIFFTLLSSFNTIASYKIYNEYTQMEAIYEDKFNEVISINPADEELATNEAELAVINSYSDIKTGFLWIQNIWRPDTSTRIVLTYKDFSDLVKHLNLNEEQKINEEQYAKIVTNSFDRGEGAIYHGWNGMFLVSILAALLTYGSMKVTVIMNKMKAKKENKEYIAGPEGGKAMTYVMPLIMGIFTLLYNAAFGIYIVAGAIVGFITGPLVNFLVDKIDDKIQYNNEMKRTASYSRTKREIK